MTWRYRIIREKLNTYGLHSVFVDAHGAVKNYSEKPETFAFGDETEFEGDDITAREHMVALLSKALADAQRAPILAFGPDGQLIEARTL